MVIRVIVAIAVLVWAVNVNALTVSTTIQKPKGYGMADTKDMNPLEALIAFFQPNNKFEYDKDLLARMILNSIYIYKIKRKKKHQENLQAASSLTTCACSCCCDFAAGEP